MMLKNALARCCTTFSAQLMKKRQQVVVVLGPGGGRLRSLSTQPLPDFTDQLYRTDVDTVRHHSEDQLGRLYIVDPEVPRVFGEELTAKRTENPINYFAPRDWTARNQVFQETCIMVRDPAVEVIKYINQSDLSQPAIRYVLYGLEGCGKSISLAHLAHYGWQEGFIVMPFAWIKRWMTHYYEVAPSTYRAGRIDHVYNANVYLKNFRQANAKRLAECVVHKEYVWSVREKTPVGAPLMDVVDMGCERLTFAADAMNILIRELKLNCNAGNCRLMVVCDGVNSLFAEKTMIHREKRKYENGPYKPWGDWLKNVAEVDECSVLRSIKKLLMNDYRNAVIVTSVDRTARIIKTDPANTWWRSMEMQMEPDTSSHLPFALLGQKGWEVMEPFIPVEVKPYTEAELDNIIDYYIEKKWLKPDCATLAARREIHFLTGRIPKDFFKFSASF